MKNAEQNGVLRWTGKLLSADDLRRHLKGQRELIVQRQTIVTPLAMDELKKIGVRLLREDVPAACRLALPDPMTTKVGYAQERPSPLVAAAVQSLEREGVSLEALPGCDGQACDWARMSAECVARADCKGVVLFCTDPGLVCCLANKIAGIRAVSVQTPVQAARAMTGVAANLLAVEMPGRTLFEVRQIVLSLCRAMTPCPENVAEILQELDGHAHR